MIPTLPLIPDSEPLKKEPNMVGFPTTGRLYDAKNEYNKMTTDVFEMVKKYLRTSGFVDRKLTDTPTDSLSVVNRNYVTLNGSTSNRPKSSVIGQMYLDTTLAAGNGKPVWWNGTGWIDSGGNYV